MSHRIVSYRRTGLFAVLCVALAIFTSANADPRPGVPGGPRESQRRLGTELELPERGESSCPEGHVAPTAGDLVRAMGIPLETVIEATLGDSDPLGTAVLEAPLDGFPVEGETYAVLSTGHASDATLPDDPEEELSTVLDGQVTSEGNDLVQLTVEIAVPPGAAFWSVDWRFFSEEFPEFVGDEFNDAFLIETPTSDLEIEDGAATSTTNVAFDPSGQPVSINTTGAVGMSSLNATDSAYNGATATLVTAAPIPPGATSVRIVFSIMDIGDPFYDTAVFLDNFRFIEAAPPESTTQIQIPVRWCAVEGAPSVDDPGQVGEGSVRDVLIRRHERATDSVFLPRAGIAFRSGASAGQPSFPILEDSNQTIGELGDVYVDTSIPGDYRELNRLITECRQVWAAGDPTVVGITVVHINRFVDQDGAPLSLLGVGGRAEPGDCVRQIVAGRAVVVDNFYTMENDPVDKILGHELGHALALRHGDGILADAGETLDGPNLMQYRFDGIELTEDQVTLIRSQALACIPDRTVGPGTMLMANATPDDWGDVPSEEASVDIVEVGAVSGGSNGDVTEFFASVGGPIPAGGQTMATNFVDVDDCDDTGGRPSTAGFQTDAIGIELITSIETTTLEGEPFTETRVLQWDGETYALVEDDRIEGRIKEVPIGLFQDLSAPLAPDDDPSIGATFEVTVPNEIVGPIGDSIRIEATATNLDTGTTDEGGGSFELLPMVPASCSATPNPARPGETVIVGVEGMPAAEPIEVLLGNESLALSATDGSGAAAVPIVVPAGTVGGDTILSVIPTDSELAITAQCSVLISSAPNIDAPPTPAAGTEFDVIVGDGVEIEVQASDVDMGDVVTLGILSMPAGATFEGVEGNPATARFAWVPAPGQEGLAILTFTATDTNGVSAPPHAVVVVVAENQPPRAECMDVDTATDPGTCEAAVSVDAGSTDPEDDPLLAEQLPPGPYGLGETEVSLRVSDRFSVDTCEARVTVADEELPTITAPLLEMECTGPEGIPASDPRVQEWTATITATDNCDDVTPAYILPIVFPPGVSEMGVVAQDTSGNSDHAVATVAVLDRIPPAVGCRLVPVVEAGDGPGDSSDDSSDSSSDSSSSSDDSSSDDSSSDDKSCEDKSSDDKSCDGDSTQRFRVEFEATDLCGAVAMEAEMQPLDDSGACHTVPVTHGQIVEVDCGSTECLIVTGEDVVIVPSGTQLAVTARDGAGHTATCYVDPCPEARPVRRDKARERQVDPQVSDRPTNLRRRPPPGSGAAR